MSFGSRQLFASRGGCLDLVMAITLLARWASRVVLTDSDDAVTLRWYAVEVEAAILVIWAFSAPEAVRGRLKLKIDEEEVDSW